MRTISKELYEKLKGNANQPVEYTIQQNLNGQEYTRELVDEILNKLDGYLADAEMPEIVVYYGESTHIIIEDSEVINGFQEELEHEQQQAQLENMDINIITAVISEFFKGRHERGWTSRTTSALAMLLIKLKQKLMNNYLYIHNSIKMVNAGDLN